MWGLLPLYWHLLENVSYLEVLGHRMFWGLLFLALVCVVIRRRETAELFHNRRALLLLTVSGLLVTFNWGLFIYAINSGHVLQSALGYYINPLISILLGVIFFKEKLTKIQTIASVLAAAGVIYFTIDYGSFPLVSLGLAISFGLYGAVKKYAGYPALPALCVETTLVLPIALVLMAIGFVLPGNIFLSTAPAIATGFQGLELSGLWMNLLLIGGGLVTMLPLVFFAQAMNSAPLSLVGFVQYLSPTINLFLGVFVFRESFTQAHLVCFVLIWIGLLLVGAETIWNLRRDKGKTTPLET
jgi:chloramphenicol-sensitive protein RarD